MNTRLLLPFVALVALGAYAPSAPAQQPPAEQTTPELPAFTNVTEAAGLKGKNDSNFSWCDFNNDGFLDFYGTRLYQNSGPPKWVFTDVTDSAFPGGAPGCAGVWADFNNDGFTDVATTVGNPGDAVCARVWKNNGKGKFTPVEMKGASADKAFKFQVSAGWADYDRDGFVDFFCVGGEDWNDGKPIYYADFLWHNENGNSFADVTSKAGMTDSPPKYGRSVSWGDYNNDGWVDCYIGNYRLQPNCLWENQKDGTFKDVAQTRGCVGTGRTQEGKTPGDIFGHTIGSAWADFNNDGNIDLVVANLVHKDVAHGPYKRGLYCDDSKVYLNSGAPEFKFTDIRAQAGIPVIPADTASTDAKGESLIVDELWSGVVCADFDNDGFMDFLVTQVYDTPWARTLLFRNTGNCTFEEVAQKLKVCSIDTYTASWADYNNDGTLDLLTFGRPEAGKPHELMLFKNEGLKRNWVELRLKGKESNGSAIGARVTLRTGNTLQIRQVEGGTSSHSQQNSPVAHFGLGSAKKIDGAEIAWPSGKVQFLKSLEPNNIHTIEEPKGPAPKVTAAKFSPNQPKTNEKITFTVEAKSGTKGALVAKYEWDWTADNVYDEETKKNSATHSYEKPGTYLVRVRVHDKSGCAVEHAVVLTVVPAE